MPLPVAQLQACLRRSVLRNTVFQERVMILRREYFLSVALLLAVTAAAPAANTDAGAVELSGGNSIPQNPSLPKLKLGPAQRDLVRKALVPKDTEVEFKLKAAKSAKGFVPQIGAKLPKGVKPDGLPSDLTQRIPQLADYAYAKMKGQILLVNAMTGKIVATIPETQPQTTGQQ